MPVLVLILLGMAAQPPGSEDGGLTSGNQRMQPNRRTELGAFLRARRARLTPGDAGLPEGSTSGRRRTPGLRREEVAQLSGVGVTWYTWLEQGRKHRHLREQAQLPGRRSAAAPGPAPR